MARIMRPALAELARQGTPFRGILFAGLMLTADGPKLIEFNVRFGDPDAQCLLPRLHSDLLPALLAACDGELRDFDLRWRADATLAVVMAARGYPGDFARHTPIGDLAAAEAVPGVTVFQAGTERLDGRLVTSGGRVLTVCGTGRDLAAAHAAAYRGGGGDRLAGRVLPPRHRLAGAGRALIPGGGGGARRIDVLKAAPPGLFVGWRKISGESTGAGHATSKQAQRPVAVVHRRRHHRGVGHRAHLQHVRDALPGPVGSRGAGGGGDAGCTSRSCTSP